MIVGVAEIGLEHVVVGVIDPELGAAAGQSHGLELLPAQDLQVVGQRLVDGDGDLPTRNHLSFNEMFRDDFDEVPSWHFLIHMAPDRAPYFFVTSPTAI